MPDHYRNPVLPGFNPDPSICRLGADHYLVTSTFEYFPGLPVYHSRDLVHWRPVGHVLDRPEQLDLDGVPPSGGLYAPTIRHHGGTWYVVCTLVDTPGRSGTFVVTAASPTGPWSDPVFLPQAEGFDPSLFFDDDGSAWFTAARPTDPAAGLTEIFLQRFDPQALALVGEQHVLWAGALVGATWAEAPHLYKVDGRYLLMIAEGGTDREHAVTVARSDTITGPYLGSPRNPVFTHRHLGRQAPVQAAGHADLVELADGSWWAVMLAIRPTGGGFHNLGRETFLAPVVWEDGWPVIAPGVGRLEPSGPGPELPRRPWPQPDPRDDFDAATLDPGWLMLRTPRQPWFSLTERPGHLRLRLRPERLGDRANPSLLVRRQQHHGVRIRALIDLVVDPAADDAAHDAADAEDGAVGGLVLMANEDDHLRLVRVGGSNSVRLVRRRHGTEETLAAAAVEPGPVVLEFSADEQDYRAGFGAPGQEVLPLSGSIDGRFLSTELAGGFTGVMVGLYASSQGGATAGHLEVDWFEYLASASVEGSGIEALDRPEARP